MKIKIVKNDTEINTIDGDKLDIKRDGGFWTTQVNFYHTDKDLLKRYDRIELYDTIGLSFPFDMQIGLTWRTFTTDTITYTQTLLGVVYTYTVKVRLEANNIVFLMVNAAYVIEDIPFIIETSISVRGIRKNSVVIWTGNVLYEKGETLITDGIQSSTTYWLVAKNPRVKINYETSPDWLYTVVLIEPNKILQGQIVPDIAFTQPLTPTYTLADLVVKVLRKSRTRLWGNRAATEFTLSSAGANKLTRLAPDDLYTKQTLLDILIRIGKIIDAFPKIVNWTEIDFEYINSSTVTYSPEYSTIELVDDTEDYATEVLMNVENMETNELAYFPNKRLATFTIPSDLFSTLDNDNAVIELPFKIKQLTKITVQALGVGGTTPGEDIEFVLFDYEEDADFYEKAKWDVLLKNSAWAWIGAKFGDNYKDYKPYYQIGDNKIYNLGGFVRDAEGQVAGWAMVIEYEPYMDLQMSKSNLDVLDGDLTYTEYLNQDQPTVSREAVAKRLENEIRNKKSTTANVTYYTDTLPSIISKHTILGNDYITTRMVITKYPLYYEVNAECSSDFNKESQFIGVDREPRKYEISNKKIVNRILRYVKKYTVTCSQIETNEQAVLLTPTHLTENGVLSLLYPLCKNITNEYVKGDFIAMCQFNYADETSLAMVIPVVYSRDDKRLTILFKTRDHINADFFKRFFIRVIPNIQRYEVQEAIAGIYTDEFGEAQSVDIKLVPITESEMIQAVDEEETELEQVTKTYLRYSYPFVIESYFNGGMYEDLWEAVTMEGETGIYLDKDRREALTFQLEYDLIEGSGITIGENYISHTAFYKELNEGSDVIMTLARLSGGEEIPCTYTSSTIDTNKAVITFTPVISGNADVIAINFRIGGELVFQKALIPTQTITNTPYKITIGIGE